MIVQEKVKAAQNETEDTYTAQAEIRILKRRGIKKSERLDSDNIYDYWHLR